MKSSRPQADAVSKGEKSKNEERKPEKRQKERQKSTFTNNPFAAAFKDKDQR
jgi:hypothetical protein